MIAFYINDLVEVRHPENLFDGQLGRIDNFNEEEVQLSDRLVGPGILESGVYECVEFLDGTRAAINHEDLVVKVEAGPGMEWRP